MAGDKIQTVSLMEAGSLASELAMPRGRRLINIKRSGMKQFFRGAEMSEMYLISFDLLRRFSEYLKFIAEIRIIRSFVIYFNVDNNLFGCSDRV